MTLTALRVANQNRQAEWCAGTDETPDLAFRGTELAGEAGEACNIIKKLVREAKGWRGSRASAEQLAEELADVVICADLTAMTVGIDLEAAVVAKFNATSEKVGLATRLGRPLTVEEDADLLEAEWSGSEASVSRVTNRILASRSTPSVPAVAELSGDGLARRVAGAAEGNLLTAAKKALAFYDGLDREHDPGEAAALDALDTAVRAALDLPASGDGPKALDAEARSSSTDPEGKVARIMANPCAQKLAPGEPFFILLGRDKNAAEAVAAWSAARRRDRGTSQKTDEADALAAAMDAYRGDGATRSSSTEAVEQEVERLRCGLEGAREAIAVAMADLSAKGWHHSERPCQTLTDASIAIRKLLARPSPAPAACKPEGETHG